MLTKIHLLEEQIVAALKVLKLSSSGWPGKRERSALSIRVAKETGESRPRDAIDLYIKAADRFIEAGDRKNYARAAE